MNAKIMKGISACPGVVSAKTFVFAHPEISINQGNISESQIENQLRLFFDGREKARLQIEKIKAVTLKNIGIHEAEIFDGHLEILLDESVESEIKSLIENELCFADKAVDQVAKQYIEMFSAMEDDYMKERAVDMKDIFRRLTANILGVHIPELSDIEEPSIVVAFDLTPSDTAQMDKSKVLGFVTEEGGATSHVAIMARTLVIPAVVGMKNLLTEISDRQDVTLDATAGELLLNPTQDQKLFYEKKRLEFNKEKERLASFKNLESITQDGFSIDLCANIGTDIDAKPAIDQGANGVGLYRSEFLYMDRSNWPSEEEQTIAYSNVVRAFEGKLVIIRTLDIGGDKSLDYFQFPFELNPFLGWRALRVCLDKVDIFKTQLRSILAASALGKVGIMYPMVISIDEVKATKKILEECKAELKQEGIAFDSNIQQGIMIETPAAALLASEFAKLVDFFSYGTNDLTQYTLAVDRGNSHIEKLYDSYHPSVLRMMAHATKEANKNGIWAGVCGELGGDPVATLFFVGIGVKELSMSAMNISRVKEIIRATSQKEAKKIAEHVLTLSTGAEIYKYLKKSVQKILA